MRSHFEEVRQIEMALVFGHLDAARYHASLLARVEDRAGLSPPHLRDLRLAASRIAATDTVAVALPIAASLVATCAACHVASGAKVALPLVAEPDEDGTVESRMARHQWAADRMWEGLVAPSDARWREGLAVLAEPALPPDGVTDDRAVYAEIERLGAALAKRAARARGATTDSARSVAFGEMLETCTACHALVRR